MKQMVFVLACALGSVGAGCDPAELEDAGPGMDAEPEPDAGPEAGPPAYYWILIEDESGTGDTGEHPGADIDAVAIVGGSGTAFASGVVSASSGAVNTEGALGEPTDPVSCFVGEFASLGGTDGYLIVGFGSETLDSGEGIEVYEVGAAACAPSGADSGSIRVSMSATPDRAGTWVELGSCPSAPCFVEVP